MNHAQSIYESIPDEIKRQFKFDVLLSVGRLIEGIEENFSILTNEEKSFLTAMGDAYEDEKYNAVYEAFGKVLTNE
jgi:hypothetical protein